MIMSENKKKKSFLLRLDESLLQELTIWAEDEFRSLNGQLEYLLTQAVRKRKAKTQESE
ncbi:MAG: Arc family DNA-binding protein [Candidatus Cloacimonetes bacterium]|nr:Arc family DNA-binding protein [Candidatus Cloacimonadota bacterium]